MNIVDPILFQCRYNPSAPAICAPGTRLNLLSYADLERSINNVARAAVSLGLVPRQVVAIFIRDKIFHAAVTLGLTRLGVVTVSGRDEPLPPELPVDAVIADDRYPFLADCRFIPADPMWLMGDGTPPAARHLNASQEDDVCRIVLTSGTTGTSKAVALSHSLLFGRIARYEYVKGNRFPLCSRVYCDLGLASSPGFRILLFVLSRGGTVFFFGADADTTLQAFDRYRIEVMIASPHGLSEYLKFYESEPTVQCGFDHIIASGSAVSRPLSERIRARMCHHLFSSYGSTEVSTIASAPAQAIADVPGAVGYVTPGVTVEIVDASNRVVPLAETGSVRVRSPYNASGYVGNPEESAKAFRDGWFYPGDLGSLTPDGMLVISGREQAVLNVGGDKINPERIEAVLTAFPAIQQAAVFTVPDALGLPEVRALVTGGAGIDDIALRRHCAERLAERLIPARFIRVNLLPRNHSGDIERDRLPDWAEKSVI